MPIRLKSLMPKNGAALALANLTVLVGPNNAGKSQTLRDIRDFITSGAAQNLIILEMLDVDLPTQVEATSELSRSPQAGAGQVSYTGVGSDLQSRQGWQVPETWLDERFKNVQDDSIRAQLLHNMGKFWCAFLDAESRFKLAAPTETYDMRTESPSNALQSFFREGTSALAGLRSSFQETFAMDIALDWAGLRRLYLKIGPKFGPIPDDRSSLDALLVNAQNLSDQGDGFKSFAGVLIALLAYPNRLLLLDEPEAFLHPAQARALGRWIASESKRRPAQLILASHSSDLLLGIISGDPSATVIRLNRTTAGTRFHQVPSSTTAGLVKSPLLSSQPVLDSLFHRGVVVCEGDPDRALYQTVLHQYLRKEGGEEVLLIHSNGKDAAKIPLEMLRNAATPVCAIVDIDVLNSAETLSDIVMAVSGVAMDVRITTLRDSIATAVEKAKQTDLLSALKEAVRQWMAVEHADLRRARKSLVTSARVKSRWDSVKSKGVDFFTGTDRDSVDELLPLLARIGVFVVPCGELEGWLKLGIAKGGQWNRAALEQLHSGSCPQDLKDFMLNVLRFLGIS